MRVLVITKIFPNRAEPLSSPFNRHQFASLARLCDVEVLATIPWFPGARAFRRWSSAGRLLEVPKSDEIDGVRVEHPRFLLLPKLARGAAGPLYAGSLATAALRRRHRVDVVLGSWAYPDGYAAVLLAELLGVPAVVKLHGSDVNVVARLRGPRRRLRWALPRAERVVAVSRPLAEEARALGAIPDRIDIVPNGIDRERFRPSDRASARQTLGLPADVLVVLYVGHVTEQKGALDLVRAFASNARGLARARAFFVGDGAGLETCRALARELSVPADFLGARPHAEVATWISACDLLALPSWNEGMPNVVLEALASGRPVVATRVGGIPDVVANDELGELVSPRDPPELGRALERTLSRSHDADGIARALAIPDWQGSARLLHASLLAALSSRAEEAA